METAKSTNNVLGRSESETCLKNSGEFNHPPHNHCFRKKVGGKGEGEGGGDVMPFKYVQFTQTDWHMRCYFMNQSLRSVKL